MSGYVFPSIQSGCFRASLSFLLLFSQSFPPHLFRSRCIRSSRYNACSEPPLGTVNIFIYFGRNAAYKIPARHAGEQRHDRIIEIMVHEIFEKSVDIYAVIVFISCKRTFNFFSYRGCFLGCFGCSGCSGCSHHGCCVALFPLDVPESHG